MIFLDEQQHKKDEATKRAEEEKRRKLEGDQKFQKMITSDEESISSDISTPRSQRKETDPNKKFSKDQVCVCGQSKKMFRVDWTIWTWHFCWNKYPNTILSKYLFTVFSILLNSICQKSKSHSVAQHPKSTKTNQDMSKVVFN